MIGLIAVHACAFIFLLVKMGMLKSRVERLENRLDERERNQFSDDQIATRADQHR